MMSDYKYILDEKGNPVAEPDALKWAMWFEKANRTVAKTKIGNATVSTIFLALDHSFAFQTGENPVLWETMIFGGIHDGDQERYTSLINAQRGHKEMVKRVRLSIKKSKLSKWRRIIL